MEISIRKGDLIEEKADLLVVNAFAGAKKLHGAAGTVDEALGGDLSAAMRDERFDGKMGSELLVRTAKAIPAKRVLLVGLGAERDFDEEAARSAAAVSLSRAKAIGAKHIVSVLHGAGKGGLSPKMAGKAVTEGVRLANYVFGRYKKNHKDRSPASFSFVTRNGRTANAAILGAELGELFARASIHARDLVNTPGQDMHPERLVEDAKEIASGKGTIRVRVHERERLEKMGAGGILGVAQGSEFPPYLVHMVYKPKGGAKKKVALVGKAVTFDSGGLSLKPADYMMTMKMDMGGAAAVLGAFSVIDELAPKAEVHGIFGAVENMPSGKAIRPGDIITAINKKSIEVLNTDAEGRLTLADALSYAAKQKPDFIVDLATLTGACLVALGEEITGLMSNDPAVATRVKEAAAAAGESVWELPLEKRYKKLLKSDYADLKNIGGRYGGALTAGLFLEEFVGKAPWVHLDIAGPAFAERSMNPYTRKGATGHGARTLCELLRSL